MQFVNGQNWGAENVLGNIRVWLCCLLMIVAGCQRSRSIVQGFDSPAVDEINATLESEDGLVVFDADGTLWADDVGEAFLLWQLEEGELLPPQEQHIRQAWTEYENGRFSEEAIWTEVALCLQGLQEKEVKAAARAFFDENFAHKVFPPMRVLVAALQAQGVDVWVVSASHRWIVEAGAETLGIPATRVIGVSARVENGLITGEPVHPVPYGEGKAEAIWQNIGRRPDLVFGNSEGDTAMLEMAARAAIVINADEGLRAIAVERGWILQQMKATFP